MEVKDSNQDGTSMHKRKPRPAQRLYVPPAQRNKKQSSKNIQEKQEKSEITDEAFQASAKQVPNNLQSNHVEVIQEEDLSRIFLEQDSSVSVQNNLEQELNDSIDTLIKNVANMKSRDIDGEQEEMQRAIVNINRKTRPLIKHVSVVKNDILHIHVFEKKTVSNVNNPLNEVSNWEDLFNEDDGDCIDQNVDVASTSPVPDDEREEEGDDVPSNKKDKLLEDLDHVIELYDIPSSFRSQDIMQIYHEIQKEATMYIKWCDDTHALLVFSTPALAQRALHLRNDVTKSRPMIQASSIAYQTAMKSDLKPAMKRPPTTMQTARRLINTHLGTRIKISKEEQEKEKEMLRKAKELKKSQRQNERDAWEGFSRPSTA